MVYQDKPFALFISWTCFGNWLPGDERGYVSNQLLPGGGSLRKANIPGTPYRSDDPLTRHQTRILMKQPAVRLSKERARSAAEALVGAARKRSWRILRGAIMANHVHVVITDCPDDGPGVRKILKGNSQTDLCAKAQTSQRWWTRGGSDHYLHTDDAILGSINYVAEQQYKLAEIIDMEVVVPGQEG